MKLFGYSYKYVLSIVMMSCFLILSGYSSPSSNTCPTPKTTLEFYWVCEPSQLNSINIKHQELTYNGKSVCLMQPPVLTSQSFITISDRSEGDILGAEVTLSDEANKAFRKSTSMAKGRQLAMVLKSSAKTDTSESFTPSSCKDQTTVLNIATVRSELGKTLILGGWQSQQQIQQLIASMKQAQVP